MKIVRTISPVLLALLVLISSTSFMVGMHLCMGDVQSVAVFAKAEGCEKEQNLPPCHRHQTAPCCEDEVFVHDADEFKSTTGLQIVPELSLALPQLHVLISEIISDVAVFRTEFISYDPPLRSYDLTVAHRTFLI